ncbi:hypothetical protein GSI_14309 [Ganoderma sinense ZZ0214-1]|uniref:F-box domain-containing protein n=1 Tax=Ganoderma sinense ZZ0214-1 TaxID=1077348 RepID=A0A2G8RNB1_9APHY|nr:hypothetical protein GSI_14309 [Ganoderma sinense ZZ0214-1]
MEVVTSTNVGVCQAVDSFAKFLSGSPNLEEVYIDYMPFSTHTTSLRRFAPPTTISLLHLRHLAFRYYLNSDHYDDDIPNPIDLFLNQVSFPPTCHMYLAAPLFGRNPDLHNTAVDILASVCQRFPGKNSVSHVFFELPGIVPGPSSPMQLVFPQGSLRLESSATSPFPHHDLFRAFPHLFSTARELRVHYTSDPATATLDSPLVSAAFPNISMLSVIRDAHKLGGMADHPGAIGTLRAGLAHLVTGTVPLPPAPIYTPPHGVDSESEPRENHDLRYPLLDTLWTTLESGDEIGELETTLAARAALGLPIRRLVVTLRYSPATAEQPASEGLDDLTRLRALRDVEEVVVMDGEVSSELREVDWLARLPDRYGLPSSIHRDWPAVWGTE